MAGNVLALSHLLRARRERPSCCSAAEKRG
jgi:hypothetical protein